MKFYPCIFDQKTNHIDKAVGPAMSHEEAIRFLKNNYRFEYRNCDAIPQPVKEENNDK